MEDCSEHLEQRPSYRSRHQPISRTFETEVAFLKRRGIHWSRSQSDYREHSTRVTAFAAVRKK
jgi:hypothetical protein